MDQNIATCLYYSAKKASEISKVIFMGAGADELFGGYNAYKKDINHAKALMKEDILNLWDRNMGRDDRVISSLNVEARFPFLDLPIIMYSNNLNIDELISHEDKVPIRNALRKFGFTKEADIKKRAMQFGSGLRDLERKLHKESELDKENESIFE